MAAKLLLAGSWVQGAGAPLETVNPADGRPTGAVGTASPKQIDEAIAKARNAQQATGWVESLPQERASVLMQIAAAIDARADELAEVQTQENGKTIRESRSQVRSAAGIFRYYAGVCETLESEMPPARGAYLALTTYEPVGLVAAITPWNSPLTMAAQKIAPALAAGNAVVVKPSEITSRVSLRLGECCTDSALPAGLLSVLPGRGDVGAALVQHEGVDQVSFTGGTATGRAIAGVAARRLVPTVLELGGKSPNIVLADADIDAAVHGVASGIFASAGQSCVAGSRLFVQESLKPEFMERLIAHTEALRVGPPWEADTDIGPLASFAHRESIERYVEIGCRDGGRIRYGGRRPEGAEYAAGAYYLPTILDGVSNSDRVCQEEIFGPVLCVLSFTDEEDLIAQANDSIYGLACGIWTADYRRAWRIARAVQAGSVWINTYKQLSIASPFGGFKDSGLGREKGLQGMRAYQMSKSIYFGL